MFKIENLFYCPVKSLSFNEANSFKIIKNKGIENDRIFAFVQNQELHELEHIIENPKSRKLNNFLTLKNTPELNKLNFIYSNEKLTLRDSTKEIISINPHTNSDQILIANTIKDLIKKDKKINFLVDKKNPFFDTMPDNSISLINKESIKDFEKKINMKIEYQRFRANIYASGAGAWSERELIGKTITINDINFYVSEEIPRCSATNLKPKTSNITMNLPNLLKKTYDHINMGIFLIPQNNGNIFCDDEIKINV